ncbi:hypothetical protein ACTXO6_03325 [Corynebacterium variabile]|uniref:hypothetical protein n=1 Tax=Corynebacterium variabile TaxID=1727 RepID=UPI003FD12BDC
MANAATTKFRPIAEQAETALNTLATGINTTNRLYQRTAADRTPAGQKKYWDELVVKHLVELGRIQTIIGNIVPTAEKTITAARAALMPEATTDQGRMAAELGVQRILGRRLDTRSVLDMVTGDAPSPTRTLLLTELAARGDIGGDVIEGVLKSTDEAYAAAVFAKGRAQTVTGVLSQKAATLQGWLTTAPNVGTMQLDVDGVAARISVADILDQGENIGHVGTDATEYTSLS